VVFERSAEGGWKEIYAAEPPRLISNTQLSPDGRLLFLGGEPDGLRFAVIDIATKKTLRDEWLLDAVSEPCCAFSQDGKRLAVGYSGGLRIYDLPSFTLRQQWKWPGGMLRLMWAEDHRHLVLANANGTVYVLRLPPGGDGNAEQDGKTE